MSRSWTLADKEPDRAPLPLFDRPHCKPVAKPHGRSLESAFRAFHAANPHVLTAFIGEARLRKSLGATKVGAKAVIEALRWGDDLKTCDPCEGFRVPNAHVAFYARLAMHRAPDLAGLFDLARQRGLAPFDPSTVMP